jgi:hypothetical protein
MKYLILLFVFSAFTVPPLNKGVFTGSVDLSNYWGNYYSNYTQSGTLNISFSASTLGGKAYVKIAANGTNDINVSGATIVRGVTNNSPWVAGNYEVLFESTISGITVNVLKY